MTKQPKPDFSKDHDGPPLPSGIEVPPGIVPPEEEPSSQE